MARVKYVVYHITQRKKKTKKRQDYKAVVQNITRHIMKRDEMEKVSKIYKEWAKCIVYLINNAREHIGEANNYMAEIRKDFHHIRVLKFL